MADNPFDTPAHRTASMFTKEPPEIAHLRELARQAEAEMHAAHKRLAAIMFAIRHYEIHYAAEKLNNG